MKILGIRMLCLIFFIVVSLYVRSGEGQKNSILLNCGTNSTINVGGRRWVGDSSTGGNVSLSSSGIEASTTRFDGDQAYAPLYKTARLFVDSLNYTFRGAQGSYFLRLHFYPFAFKDRNVNDSSFAVEADGITLLSGFNVPDEILNKNLYIMKLGGNSSFSYLVKEFFFTVSGDVLVVDFIPTKGSFGFVNAIEIVNVEDKLFVDSVRKVGSNGETSNLSLSKRGIETMYRLNVGGPPIKADEDSILGRVWEADSSYMLTANAGSDIHSRGNITYGSANETSIAPLVVYRSARTTSNTQVMEKRFNMSWKFEVDPDFDYIVRLHFCELSFDKANERIFRIYINNKTAADNFDIFEKAGGMNKTYHQDFFDVVPSVVNTLWIQLGPDTTTGAAGTDALLNGLEVFKLSRNGNLAHVGKVENPGGRKTSRNMILWASIGAGIASIVILAASIALITCFCHKRRNKETDTKKHPPGWRPLFLLNSTADAKGSSHQSLYGSMAPNRTGRRFTLAELKAATNNFEDSLVIGVGGFGKVYKGEIEDGTLTAIKRANPQSQQGLTEFETEIEMLSKLRHKHLVSMIGFCDEQDEMILVYEYMANGTLRSHIFGSNLPPLSWKQRIEVCIGAARGLHYLHTGADRGIIHRDVKTTNILLDENFVAKMADFGLSKTGPSLEHTHVSTAVKGSFGYLDPEYFRRQQLTEKSDIYSFGVVLFEVICARAVINPSLPRDQINLAEWAMRWQRQRSLETIIDPHLKGTYSPESLTKFAEIAEKCLADEGKSRPAMGEVLWHLEYVLQVQEAWLRSINGDNSFSSSQVLADQVREDVDVLEATKLDSGADLDPKRVEDE